MELLLALVILAVVVALVAAPFYARREPERRRADDVAGLEAARDAKYSEIRELELDLRTGKLSDEDYRATDRALRAEAIEILHRLDVARGEEPSGD